jgi:DNA polymerase III delta subunit
MSYRNLIDEVKKGLPSPCYVLISSDPFLHSEAVFLIKSLISPAEMDFNFQSVDLLGPKESSIPVEHILDALNTVPFFSGRKFMVLENFQKLLKKDQKEFQ